MADPFAIGTCDPHFKPDAPVLVNGYRFEPAPTEFVAVRVAMRPGAAAIGENPAAITALATPGQIEFLKQLKLLFTAQGIDPWAPIFDVEDASHGR